MFLSYEDHVLNLLSCVASFLWKAIISGSCFKHILFLLAFLPFLGQSDYPKLLLNSEAKFYFICPIPRLKD